MTEKGPSIAISRKARKMFAEKIPQIPKDRIFQSVLAARYRGKSLRDLDEGENPVLYNWIRQKSTKGHLIKIYKGVAYEFIGDRRRLLVNVYNPENEINTSRRPENIEQFVARQEQAEKELKQATNLPSRKTQGGTGLTQQKQTRKPKQTTAPKPTKQKATAEHLFSVIANGKTKKK